MTLKTLADIRKLLGYIPKERRQLLAWRNVEKYLRAGDVDTINVALQLALQLECVPYIKRAAIEGGNFMLRTAIFAALTATIVGATQSSAATLEQCEASYLPVLLHVQGYTFHSRANSWEPDNISNGVYARRAAQDYQEWQQNCPPAFTNERRVEPSRNGTNFRTITPGGRD